MRRRGYKHQKKGGQRFVMLTERLQRSEAWATMRPGPRALYIEVKRRFNGYNNGSIALSHRQAATALNVSKNTVGPWFRELEKRGFISNTQTGHLGAEGAGVATLWAVEEERLYDERSPRSSFLGWREKKQEPVPENGTSCPRTRDGKSNARLKS